MICRIIYATIVIYWMCVYEEIWTKLASPPSWRASLFYCFWRFRNECLFEGKISIKEAGKQLDFFVSDFAGDIQFPSFPTVQKRNKLWSPPNHGWWKINCEATFVEGNAAFALVVRNDDGLLVVACTKLVQLFLAYEAEMKYIEWAFIFCCK